MHKHTEDKVHTYEGKFTRNVKTQKLWNWFYLTSVVWHHPTEKWMFPLHNLICEEGGGKWWLIERSAKISWSILLQHRLQKRTCQKNELRYFRWNSGTISFPSNSWPAAGGSAEECRWQWITICTLLLLLSWPSRLPEIATVSWECHSFLRDVHGPKIAWLWIFYGSHGDFSSVLMHAFPHGEFFCFPDPRGFLR